MHYHIGRKIAAVAVSAFLSITSARAADTATANDTARFLAGMAPSADSALAPLTRDPSWQRHARFFDNAFGQLEQSQLSKIRTWSAKNLPSARPTMFYMFSGPDFIYADAFYPKATTYVLSALEPVGSVPDVARMRGNIGPTLYQIEQSMGSIISFSFFITKQMRMDLNAGQAGGVLPILYVFLARSGKTIRDVTLVSVDADGKVTPRGQVQGRNASPGVKIVFAGSDGAEKTLYYFTTNLANDGVRSSGFLKFCDTLAPADSLVKSASYLMHSPNFSSVRDYILGKSAVVIQDDSGIPLRYFDVSKWKFSPFGRYLGPIGEFPGRYQANYAELFRKSQPMDFGIGYRWRTHETHLLLAIKSP
jgi:hypothetical protein